MLPQAAANGGSTTAAAAAGDAPVEAAPAGAAATRAASGNGAAAGAAAADAAAADTGGAPAADAAAPAEEAAGKAGDAEAAASAADPPASQPPTPQQEAEEALKFVPACVVHFEFEAEEAAEDVGYPEVKAGLGGREQGIFYVEYQKACSGPAWCTACTAWCCVLICRQSLACQCLRAFTQW